MQIFGESRKNLHIVLYEKNSFIFNFGPWEVPQLEIAWKWKGMFPVGALCKVRNQIWKHFYHKVLFNYFLKTFWPMFNKVRKLISYCIFKSCAEWFGGYFLARNLISLPNGLYLPPKQPWGSLTFGFCHHHL